MSLKEYREKRDFTKSPEPRGDDGHSAARKKTKELFFCVQKHLASSLHYDFRLEHEGVLLSWAVPKGPALDPTVKRLAMHVEDHPLEYGTFEGVIPDGYGAGVVMLWDEGTWTPESEDVDAAIKKGDLKIRLNGYKLKGSWALIRTKGWGGGSKGGSSKSWLLIKHKDEWAGPIDITAFAPLSVKSGGSFLDILKQETPDLWQSHRSAPGKQGGEMLAKIVQKVLDLEKEEGRSTDAAAADAGEDDEAAKPARKTAAKKTSVKKASAAGKPAAARKAGSAKAATAADAPAAAKKTVRKK